MMDFFSFWGHEDHDFARVPPEYGEYCRASWNGGNKDQTGAELAAAIREMIKNRDTKGDCNVPESE
jgi:hypothetical protein